MYVFEVVTYPKPRLFPGVALKRSYTVIAGGMDWDTEKFEDEHDVLIVSIEVISRNAWQG